MAGDGTPQGFSAQEFRDAIRSTMVMALPQIGAERITFVWKEVRDYPIKDPADDPYSWSATPSSDTAGRSLQVPAAVQWGLSGTDDTALGQFDNAKAIVTLLDVDYVQVADADEIVINSVHYDIDAVGPPIGLFDVTVYMLNITARG